MKCKQCGKIDKSGDRFCTECGQSLENVIQQMGYNERMVVLVGVNLVLAIPFGFARWKIFVGIVKLCIAIFGSAELWNQGIADLKLAVIVALVTLFLMAAVNILMGIMIHKHLSNEDRVRYRQSKDVRTKKLMRFLGLPLVGCALIIALVTQLDIDLVQTVARSFVVLKIILYALMQCFVFGESLLLSNLAIKRVVGRKTK